MRSLSVFLLTAVFGVSSAGIGAAQANP